MRRTVPLTTAFVLAATLPARAQAPPSPAEYLGHGIGASFTDAARAVSYCEALAGASPRVRLVRYGETVEGRDLVLLVIAPERVHGRLEEILATNARLADPALPPAAASDIARGNPAVAWLSYGIHGNESASTEAALWTAWDLPTPTPVAVSTGLPGRRGDTTTTCSTSTGTGCGPPRRRPGRVCGNGDGGLRRSTWIFTR